MHFKKQLFKEILLPIRQLKVLPINFSRTFAYWIISVLLLTITIINLNHVFENLYTMDDFNFTNFFIDRLMGCSTKGSSYCCFCKVISINHFQDVLLKKFISSYLPQLTKEFQFCLLSAYRKLWQIFFSKRIAHCSFRRPVWNSCFEKVFLMTFISTFSNLVKWYKTIDTNFISIYSNLLKIIFCSPITDTRLWTGCAMEGVDRCSFRIVV